MTLQPVPTASAPATPPRVIPMTPRRLVASALIVFTAGFLIGYAYHQPSEPTHEAGYVDAIRKAQKETDRILTEQRQLLNCVPVGAPAPAPVGSASRPRKTPP